MTNGAGRADSQMVTTSPLWSKAQGGLALIKARAALATAHVAQERIFGHLNDDVWFSVNTNAYRRYPLLQRVLPSLPDAETQIRFIGNAGDPALKEAFAAYQLIRLLAERAGCPISRKTTVLDFGCGWGRTLRFFLRDVPATQLHGADVLPLAIQLCKQTNPWCQFWLVPSLPPSDLPSGTFDVIYLYSVFSHLSEAAHLLWLAEFQRLLRPGGLLFATTWQRDYIQYCADARRGDTTHTHVGSLTAFPNTEQSFAEYDRGEFCHSAVGGGDELTTEFYGESCIPEAYVRRRWADRFALVDYLKADGRSLSQNMIVARRK